MITSLTKLLTATNINVPNVWVVHAKEEFSPITSFVTDFIRKRIVQPQTTYKLVVESGFNFIQLEYILNSTSLFDEVNYIELCYKTKPTTEHYKKINQLLENIAATNYVVILTDELNKRDLASKALEPVNSYSTILGISNTDMYQFLSYKLGIAEIEVDRNGLQLLLDLNQNNPTQLIQAIDKISLTYPKKTKLTVEEIKQQVSDDSQYNVFQLSQAYLSGNLVLANKILLSFYQAPEDAILIAWMLTEDIRKLLKIKAKLKQGSNTYQIFQELRIWGDATNNFEVATRRINYAKLIMLMNEVAVLDTMVKGIETGNVFQQLSKLVTNMCTN